MSEKWSEMLITWPSVPHSTYSTVVVAPLMAPLGMLIFSMNITKQPMATFSMWLNLVSTSYTVYTFNIYGICFYWNMSCVNFGIFFSEYILVISWNIFLVEAYYCDVRIYTVINILVFNKTTWQAIFISSSVGGLFQIMFRNCRWLGSVAWHMEMDKRCCITEGQPDAHLIWQPLQTRSLFWRVYLHIVDNCGRSPTSRMILLSNGDQCLVWKACFRHCSIIHKTKLVIIDISSTIITFAFLIFYETLLGFGSGDNYVKVCGM